VQYTSYFQFIEQLVIGIFENA